MAQFWFLLPSSGGVPPPPGAAMQLTLLLGVNLSLNSGLLTPTEASCWGSTSNSKEVSKLELSSSPSLGQFSISTLSSGGFLPPLPPFLPPSPPVPNSSGICLLIWGLLTFSFLSALAVGSHGEEPWKNCSPWGSPFPNFKCKFHPLSTKGSAICLTNSCKARDSCGASFSFSIVTTVSFF